MKARVAILLLALFGAPGASPVGAAPSWNELSREAAAVGDYARALDYLKRIEISSPGDPLLRARKCDLLAAYGVSLYRQKKYSEAESALQEALALNPRNPDALAALGYIAYDTQRLEEAGAFWRDSVALRPDRDLAAQLERLGREALVENDLAPSRAANFEFRFRSDALDYDIFDIQNYLLEAHREVGRDFMYYPSRTIVVILYTRPEFESLRSSPDWLGGMYDGKIRLPIPAGGLSPEDFKKILWHEYTHAILHDLAGNRCPRWLQEGLAQFEEAKVDAPSLDRLEKAWKRGGLIPLGSLSARLEMGNRPETAALAYAEAFSLVDHLVAKYGFFRINLILPRLIRGENWETAVREELGLSPEELEIEWRERLEINYGIMGAME